MASAGIASLYAAKPRHGEKQSRILWSDAPPQVGIGLHQPQFRHCARSSEAIHFGL